MTPYLDRLIESYLRQLDFETFTMHAEWIEYFQKLKPELVNEIYQKKYATINSSDIRGLDLFILFTGKHYQAFPKLPECIELGIRQAVTTQDESLIESLIIVLKHDVLKQEELLALALQKMATNANIHRVLYNCVREELSEVRGYVGDGSTSYNW